MTSPIVYLLSCDHAGCEQTAPKDEAAAWTDAIFTHGCPDHGVPIKAHQATVTPQTRGRGRTEKTTWYLACACNWAPTPAFQVHSAARLKLAHLAHVADATA